MAAALGGADAVAPARSPPNQALFEAFDLLAKRCLIERWTGSIKFRALPADSMTILSRALDESSVREGDICNCLGKSAPCAEVCRLHLEPAKFDKPPLAGECVANNPH